MLFSLFSAPLAPSPEQCATAAAIRCLLAYAHSLQDCRIDVEIAGGVIMLTGSAPCIAAVNSAIGIAEDFTSKPVLSSIQVVTSR